MKKKQNLNKIEIYLEIIKQYGELIYLIKESNIYKINNLELKTNKRTKILDKKYGKHLEI